MMEFFEGEPPKTSCLSLKTQELTAIFLAVRLYCSLIIEYDIHTFLDFATLISTALVIYMMRFKLNSSYAKELDNMPRYYTVVPSLVLAIIIHPFIYKVLFGRVFWAFCVYLESVPVLPQLRLMQNAQLVETRGSILFQAGMFWFPAVLLAELVQTFILADFCYYLCQKLYVWPTVSEAACVTQEKMLNKSLIVFYVQNAGIFPNI